MSCHGMAWSSMYVWMDAYIYVCDAHGLPAALSLSLFVSLVLVAGEARRTSLASIDLPQLHHHRPVAQFLSSSAALATPPNRKCFPFRRKRGEIGAQFGLDLTKNQPRSAWASWASTGACTALATSSDIWICVVPVRCGCPSVCVIFEAAVSRPIARVFRSDAILYQTGCQSSKLLQFFLALQSCISMEFLRPSASG